MALARCSIPTRRYSSAMIDVLKTAGATSATDVIPRNLSLQQDQPGMSTSEQGKSIWDPITEHLLAAKRRARANALAQANEPPEDVWRRRSELIISELRLTGMSGIATRSVTAQAKKMRGAAAYDAAGTNEAEVPFVASGRTVTSSDFGRAIMKLGQILSKNRVRQEWRRDKYFTKPFQLRYQLRSRRHRQRFAAAIRRKVQIVQAIKRRGM